MLRTGQSKEGISMIPTVKSWRLNRFRTPHSIFEASKWSIISATLPMGFEDKNPLLALAHKLTIQALQVWKCEGCCKGSLFCDGFDEKINLDNAREEFRDVRKKNGGTGVKDFMDGMGIAVLEYNCYKIHRSLNALGESSEDKFLVTVLVAR